MKKFLLFICVSLFAVTTFAAEFKMPNFTTRDINVINSAIQLAKDENKPVRTLVTLDILKAISEKNITTFAALQTEIETIINGYVTAGKLTAKSAEKLKIYRIKQLALRGGFGEEVQKAGWQYTLSHPDNYDVFYYYPKFRKITGLTNEQCYTKILTYYKEVGPINGSDDIQAIKQFVNLCPIVTGINTQKEDLQTLNRIFSPKLLADKATYEPVVALIRTTLETY